MFSRNSSRDMVGTKIADCLALLVSICLIALLAACKATPRWGPSDGAKRGVYPDKHWQKVKTPEQFGWSSDKLAEARKYSKRIDTAAVMIVDDGVVIDAWGEITRKFQCHSMRKSLMSALIGVHVGNGNMVSSAQIGRLLWHILDAAGETDIGELPTLAGAKGDRLTGDSLQKTLKGCTIKADNFTVKFLQDNRIQLWIKEKLPDASIN